MSHNALLLHSSQFEKQQIISWLHQQSQKKLESHNSEANRAGKPNAPFELIFYSAFVNKVDVLECEKYFKTTLDWRRIRKMLENSLREYKFK